MSGYRTHLLFYLGLSALLAYAWTGTGRPMGVGEVSAVALGAVYTLLPDADSPSSKVRKMLGKTVFAVVVLALAAGILYQSTHALVAAAGSAALFLMLWNARHRGFFHTTYAGVLLSAPLLLAGPLYAAMGFIGYCSHLLLDGRLLR